MFTHFTFWGTSYLCKMNTGWVLTVTSGSTYATVHLANEIQIIFHTCQIIVRFWRKTDKIRLKETQTKKPKIEGKVLSVVYTRGLRHCQAVVHPVSKSVINILPFSQLSRNIQKQLYFLYVVDACSSCYVVHAVLHGGFLSSQPAPAPNFFFSLNSLICFLWGTKCLLLGLNYQVIYY